MHTTFNFLHDLCKFNEFLSILSRMTSRVYLNNGGSVLCGIITFAHYLLRTKLLSQMIGSVEISYILYITKVYKYLFSLKYVMHECLVYLNFSGINFNNASVCSLFMNQGTDSYVVHLNLS